MGGPPPTGHGAYGQKPPPPKGLRDLPHYLWELIRGFFCRLTYIIRLVWETGHWILWMLLVIALLNGILPIVGSLLSKEILNELQGIISERVAADAMGVTYTVTFFGSMVMLLLIGFFLYRILNQVVTRVNAAVTRIAGEKVVRYVRMQIMNKAKEVDISSFDLPEFYEKLENANREAGIRPITVLGSTFDAISKLISLVGYIIILVTIPRMWWVAPVMIVISIPTAAVNFIYKQKTFQYIRRRSKDRRQMNYYSDLMVNKDMVKEIRMLDLGDTLTERYDGVFQQYYTGMKRLIVRESLWQIGLTVLSSVINCVFFAMIAVRVLDGSMQIGDYSLYTGALTSVASTVGGLITVSATIYEGTLFIDNFMSFMQVRPSVTATVTPPRTVARGVPHTVEFVDVSFSYPNAEKPVLRHISLTLRPGETAVLVGLNGAGKTTFLKLLTRLYDPTEGKILLDGHDLREYDPKELYRMFGMIFQDFGKYAVSVSDNIRFGDIHRKADDAELRTAAKQANAEEMIARLPDGYETPLMRFFEPNGTELSIGQWQKLAIARAFYSQSDILILDEPTASLDPMAEQEIFAQFEQLRRDKTTIFVSHRLSSAVTASKILVLDHGELVEEGTHHELMEKRGHYFALFSTQAQRYQTENR